MALTLNELNLSRLRLAHWMTNQAYGLGKTEASTGLTSAWTVTDADEPHIPMAVIYDRGLYELFVRAIGASQVEIEI